MSDLDLDKLEAALEAWHNGAPALPVMEAAPALFKAARELTECRRAYPVLADAYNQSALEVDALRAKIAEARKALEPFAKWATDPKARPTENNCWEAAEALASLRDTAPAKPEEDRRDETMKPCPFCGGIPDPTGWLGNDGRSGPECDNCGATAQSTEDWNQRVTDSSHDARAAAEAMREMAAQEVRTWRTASGVDREDTVAAIRALPLPDLPPAKPDALEAK